MRRQRVEDMREGDAFAGVLLVKSCRLLTAKSGNYYVDLELVDRTGRVKGKIWKASRETAEELPPNTFAFFRGHVERFRDELQLIVESFRKVAEEEIEPADFMPTSRFGTEEMESFLRRKAESLANPHLRALWEAALADEEFMEGFRTCPAAVSYHHVFLGGLMEHTCEVVRLAEAVARVRPELDRDLLLTGALLHDAGKVEEYSRGPAFTQLERGLLLGHLYMGAEMIERWTAGIEGFPRALADQLKHLVLSHHGTKEFGSPVEPCFAEAIVLHYVDNIDAKLNNVRTTIEQDEGEKGEAFTRQQSPMLRRRLLKTTLRPEPEGYDPFGEAEEGASGEGDEAEGESTLF
ncbi:MAG: hypothetical protein DRP90_03120 [Planctomycetota bacterium]|nr:MAG: hypothetical protein DRP90_03120 [Planctomycetota bacterium]